MTNDKTDFTNATTDMATRKLLMQEAMVEIFRLKTEQQQDSSFTSSFPSSKVVSSFDSFADVGIASTFCVKDSSPLELS